ncbi:MAG: hypothetical protein KBE23_06855 [Chloroflexi bacterium]|nr:hypothetical protein [Chloroflexota bacterium]MBP7042445.1 hypothetical protein [Chloroflexota bacterium]
MAHPDNSQESKQEHDPEVPPISRRKALQILAAAAGTVTLTSVMGQWMKPVLRVGVLPAHAQTSGLPSSTPSSTPTGTATSTPTATPTSTATPTATATPQIIQGLLGVVLDWGFEVGEIDLDLEVFDPGDNSWATPANLSTLTLVHGGDAGLGGSGVETVDSTTGVVAGTYQIWLRIVSTNSQQGFLIFASIDVTVNVTNENRGISFDAPPASNSTIHVADVTYPAGTISWLIP